MSKDNDQPTNDCNSDATDVSQVRVWYESTLRVDAALDYCDAIWALNEGVEQMADGEDTLQRVKMPDGSFMQVNLDADRQKKNVYEITEG